MAQPALCNPLLLAMSGDGQCAAAWGRRETIPFSENTKPPTSLLSCQLCGLGQAPYLSGLHSLVSKQKITLASSSILSLKTVTRPLYLWPGCAPQEDSSLPCERHPSLLARPAKGSSPTSTLTPSSFPQLRLSCVSG